MYLVEWPSETREAEAIRRLFEMPLISSMLHALGIDYSFSWFLLQLGTNRILEKSCLMKSRKPGDVDILAGRLSWSDQKKFDELVKKEAKEKPSWHPSYHYSSAALKLAASGEIKWPPSMDYLVGIEVKCAYFDENDNDVKSRKSSDQDISKVRSQVEGLLKMGFNKVTLLDIIANPPADGKYLNAWMNASDISFQSVKKMKPVLSQRLSDNSASGHWVWSLGAVIGGDETRRGSGGPEQLQPAQFNPYLKDEKTQRCRQKMEEELSQLLETLPYPPAFPGYLPVVLTFCKTCRKLHGIKEDCSE